MRHQSHLPLLAVAITLSGLSGVALAQTATTPTPAPAGTPTPAPAASSTPTPTPATLDPLAAITNAKDTFTVSPALLTGSSGSSGTTLGLNYNFLKTYSTTIGGDESKGEKTVTKEEVENAKIWDLKAQITARGTLGASASDVSNKMNDFALSGLFSYDTKWAYIEGGATATYETDQSTDDRDAMYGAAVAVGKLNVFGVGDYLFLYANYGTVNPTGDTQRQKLVGTLTNYRRANLEGSYSYSVNSTLLSSIEFDYRYYKEESPPAAIQAAGLDVNKLWLIRLNFQKYFIEYANGSLPFDQQSSRSVKVGWSTDFFK